MAFSRRFRRALGKLETAFGWTNRRSFGFRRAAGCDGDLGSSVVTSTITSSWPSKPRSVYTIREHMRACPGRAIDRSHLHRVRHADIAAVDVADACNSAALNVSRFPRKWSFMTFTENVRVPEKRTPESEVRMSPISPNIRNPISARKRKGVGVTGRRLNFSAGGFARWNCNSWTEIACFL